MSPRDDSFEGWPDEPVRAGGGSPFTFELRQTGRMAKVKLWFDDEAAAQRFCERFVAGAEGGRISLSMVGLTVTSLERA